MRFYSKHPVDVPDETAELVFLALATKLNEVDKDELAAAFVESSVYEAGGFPKAFGAMSSGQWSTARIGGTLAVLLDGLECEGFRVAIVDRRDVDLTVVVASDPAQLTRLWDRGDGYGPRPEIVVREAQSAYVERHRESSQETLARALGDR